MNENRAPELIAAVAILVSLSSVIIFLRITTRVITKVGFGADDYIIFVAWVGSRSFMISPGIVKVNSG